VLCLLLAGCTVSVSNEPVVFPGDRVELVAGVRTAPGLTSMSYAEMGAPDLLIYSDGRAVQNAAKTLTLSAGEVTDLVRELRGDLHGLPSDVEAQSGRYPPDAGSTTLAVRTREGALQTVSAPGLRAADGYPRRLARAAERMTALARRVEQQGAAFASDRVRLYVEPAQASNAAIHPWPEGVTPPEHRVDLDGDAARAAVAAFPNERWSSSWHAGKIYMLADDSLRQVWWRYLAPDEDSVT
jgi:hypothetical protein